MEKKVDEMFILNDNKFSSFLLQLPFWPTWEVSRILKNEEGFQENWSTKLCVEDREG